MADPCLLWLLETTWKTLRKSPTLELATDAAMGPARGLAHDASETEHTSTNTALNSGSEAVNASRFTGRTPAWDINARTPAPIRTPAWGISSTGGSATPNIAAIATPLAPAGGWGGGFGDDATPAPRTGGYGGGYNTTGSSSSTAHDAATAPAPAFSHGYGAATSSAQSGATTPAYGYGYGGMSGAPSARPGARSSAYATDAARPGVSMATYGHGYGTAAQGTAVSGTAVPGTTVPFGRASAQPSPYNTGYGAARPSMPPPGPMPAFSGGYGSAMPTDAGYGGTMGSLAQRPVGPPMGFSAPRTNTNPTHNAYGGASGSMGMMQHGASGTGPLPGGPYHTTLGGRQGDEFDVGVDSQMPPPPGKTSGQRVDVYKMGIGKKAPGEGGARQ